MKIDICKACRYFVPLFITERCRSPAHCINPFYVHVFGCDVGGFPSGIDIIHCDGFTQHSINCGDIKIVSQSDDMKGVSYTINSMHEKRRIPDLHDNSQNIKIRYL